MINQQGSQNRHASPACIGVEKACEIFGWPSYFLPVLMSAGHLKPLGKPSQNSRKWFARTEIERLSSDLAWLDKAVRIVEKYVRDQNEKQRGKEPILAPEEVLQDN